MSRLVPLAAAMASCLFSWDPTTCDLPVHRVTDVDLSNPSITGWPLGNATCYTPGPNCREVLFARGSTAAGGRAGLGVRAGNTHDDNDGDGDGDNIVHGQRRRPTPENGGGIISHYFPFSPSSSSSSSSLLQTSGDSGNGEDGGGSGGGGGGGGEAEENPGSPPVVSLCMGGSRTALGGEGPASGGTVVFGVGGNPAAYVVIRGVRCDDTSLVPFCSVEGMGSSSAVAAGGDTGFGEFLERGNLTCEEHVVVGGERHWFVGVAPFAPGGDGNDTVPSSPLPPTENVSPTPPAGGSSMPNATACIPDCSERKCGADNCGGDCGICPVSGVCQTPRFECVVAAVYQSAVADTALVLDPKSDAMATMLVMMDKVDLPALSLQLYPGPFFDGYVPHVHTDRPIVLQVSQMSAATVLASTLSPPLNGTLSRWMVSIAVTVRILQSNDEAVTPRPDTPSALLRSVQRGNSSGGNRMGSMGSGTRSSAEDAFAAITSRAVGDGSTGTGTGTGTGNGGSQASPSSTASPKPTSSGGGDDGDDDDDDDVDERLFVVMDLFVTVGEEKGLESLCLARLDTAAGEWKCVDTKPRLIRNPAGTMTRIRGRIASGLDGTWAVIVVRLGAIVVETQLPGRTDRFFIDRFIGSSWSVWVIGFVVGAAAAALIFGAYSLYERFRTRNKRKLRRGDDSGSAGSHDDGSESDGLYASDSPGSGDGDFALDGAIITRKSQSRRLTRGGGKGGGGGGAAAAAAARNAFYDTRGSGSHGNLIGGVDTSINNSNNGPSSRTQAHKRRTSVAKPRGQPRRRGRNATEEQALATALAASSNAQRGHQQQRHQQAQHQYHHHHQAQNHIQNQHALHGSHGSGTGDHLLGGGTSGYHGAGSHSRVFPGLVPHSGGQYGGGNGSLGGGSHAGSFASLGGSSSPLASPGSHAIGLPPGALNLVQPLGQFPGSPWLGSAGNSNNGNTAGTLIAPLGGSSVGIPAIPGDLGEDVDTVLDIDSDATGSSSPLASDSDTMERQRRESGERFEEGIASILGMINYGSNNGNNPPGSDLCMSDMIVGSGEFGLAPAPIDMVFASEGGSALSADVGIPVDVGDTFLPFFRDPTQGEQGDSNRNGAGQS